MLKILLLILLIPVSATRASDAPPEEAADEHISRHRLPADTYLTRAFAERMPLPIDSGWISLVYFKSYTSSEGRYYSVCYAAHFLGDELKVHGDTPTILYCSNSEDFGFVLPEKLHQEILKGFE